MKRLPSVRQKIKFVFALMLVLNLLIGGALVYYYHTLLQTFTTELSDIVAVLDGVAKERLNAGVTVVQEQLQWGQWFLWAAILSAALLGLFVAGWVYRHVSRPMERVIQVADDLSSGLDLPISVEASEQETRQILIALRVMQESLKEQLAANELSTQHVRESLQYARKIQHSLLPKAEHRLAEDHFIWWEPRDEVGGDMFWQQQSPEGSLMAVLDSTGHGVPGAFLSMLGVSALHHIVKNRNRANPATVLRDLNRHLKTSLNQQQQQSEAQASDDGMDVGLCFFDQENNHITFAGAKMSLIVLRAGEAQVLKGDKVSVGYRGCSVNQAYTTHGWRCEPGDVFYLLSDGLTDQIGHHKGKRLPFGNKRLKRLLQHIHQQPFADQLIAIQAALTAHQGAEPRRDDVTVFGFGVGHFRTPQVKAIPAEDRRARWLNAI